MRERITLKAGSKAFTQWHQVTWSSSIEQVVTNATVGILGAYSYRDGIIDTGDIVELFIGEDPVLKGVVDATSFHTDPLSRSFSVTIRSATREIVDCSAPLGTWRNIRLGDLITELTAGHNIPLIDQADVYNRVINRHRTEEGESIWDAIDRLSRDQGYLVTDSPTGALVLITAKRARDTGEHITYGDNRIIQTTADRDMSQRFNSITVRGQTVYDSLGFDYDAEGQAGDAGVAPNRKLILRPERGINGVNAANRARWEVTTRAGKSLNYRLVLRTWRDKFGLLWEKNTLITITDYYAGITDLKMLVRDVDFTLDDSGRTCELTLVPPSAFEPMPERVRPAALSRGVRWKRPPKTAPDYQPIGGKHK